MSKYRELVQNPPKIEVTKKDPREVHFKLISCMCDNEHTFSFKRQEDGTYSKSLGIFAISNLQMEGDWNIDLNWAAEDQDWDKVVDIINTGTEAVASVRYR